MTALSYYDTPAHPLGLVTHPDWDAVRDRWRALYCASVLNQARDDRDQKRGGVSASPLGSTPNREPGQ